MIELERNVKTLDLREMPPFERHGTIFTTWEALPEEHTLRIVNDHDPKPLYYQFEAEQKGNFDWAYEQRGPRDWIVRIRKGLSADARKTAVKSLIKELHAGGDVDDLKEKGKDFLRSVSPTDLALIEQEIIEEGVSRQEMRSLCNLHLDIMKESLEGVEMNLEPGHPCHTLSAEHQEILGFVEKLKPVNQALEKAGGFEDVEDEVKLLRHIAEHLVEADLHHQREEEVLFPAMEKRGVTEPPAIMRDDHVDLKARKKALLELAKSVGAMEYNVFVERVKENSEYIIGALPDHIYKEDNILYPLAVEVIPDEEWGAIKAGCDNIGYCCFTPSYLIEHAEKVD